MNLQDLRNAVVEDGKVDPVEVADIRAVIYDDNRIETAEANLLFEINNAVTGNPDNDPSWDDLFVSAITEYVLQDDETPGNVDDEEAEYLIQQVGIDGNLDALEERLLLNIEAEAVDVSPILNDFLDENGL